MCPAELYNLSEQAYVWPGYTRDIELHNYGFFKITGKKWTKIIIQKLLHYIKVNNIIFFLTDISKGCNSNLTLPPLDQSPRLNKLDNAKPKVPADARSLARWRLEFTLMPEYVLIQSILPNVKATKVDNLHLRV